MSSPSASFSSASSVSSASLSASAPSFIPSSVLPSISAHSQSRPQSQSESKSQSMPPQAHSQSQADASNSRSSRRQDNRKPRNRRGDQSLSQSQSHSASSGPSSAAPPPHTPSIASSGASAAAPLIVSSDSSSSVVSSSGAPKSRQRRRGGASAHSHAPSQSHSHSHSQPQPHSAAAAVDSALSSSAPAPPPPDSRSSKGFQSSRGASNSSGRGRGGRGRGGSFAPRSAAAAIAGSSVPGLQRSDSTTSSISSSSSLPASSDESSVSADAIIARLRSSKGYECLICSEKIGVKSPIWSCSQCFVLIHWDCAEQWSQSSKGSAGFHWCCPLCQYNFVERIQPYRCFCGKVPQPDYNPYLTPHSRGQICGQKHRRQFRSSASGSDQSRFSSCPHPCQSMCHPGLCPLSCGITNNLSCYCGKSSILVRCGESEKKELSCGAACGRLLSCGVHKCTKVCHFGACEGPNGCSETVEGECFCGSQTKKSIPCSSGVWDSNGQFRFSCESRCNQLLDCGNHRCELLCHSPSIPHSQCSRLPVFPQSCACGQTIKAAWKRQSCLDPLPTCGEPCSKLLECKRHKCRQDCHDGPCQPCSESVELKCRCRKTTLRVPCQDAVNLSPERLTCNSVCKAKLSCGKHTCGSVCCLGDASAHLCMRQCDRPLSCGRHSCDSLDHKGPCPPCGVVYRDGLVCPCGRTRSAPNSRCSEIHLECRYPCSKRRSCGHPCKSNCHNSDCPPCAMLTSKLCAGGHKEMRNIPCFAVQPSCGITCKKPLDCGSHFCLRPCHSGDCSELAFKALEAAKVGKPVDPTQFSCGQKCSKQRSCRHPCPERCHPSSPCPNDSCVEIVIVTCPCGRQKKQIKCFQRIATSLLCDDQCDVEKRNARFREALSINGTASSPAAIDQRPLIPYPAELLEKILSCNLLDYLIKTEQSLREWLDSSDLIKYFKFNAYRDQRWLLFQLANVYSLQHESFDMDGPNRTFRMIKQSSSSAPAMSLSDAVRSFLNHRQNSMPFRTLDISVILHIFDLDYTPRILPEDLHILLRDWDGEYRLNWIDSTHALVVLSSQQLLNAVKAAFIKRGFLAAPDPQSYSADDASQLLQLYKGNAIFRAPKVGTLIRPKPKMIQPTDVSPPSEAQNGNGSDGESAAKDAADEKAPSSRQKQSQKASRTESAAPADPNANIWDELDADEFEDLSAESEDEGWSEVKPRGRKQREPLQSQSQSAPPVEEWEMAAVEQPEEKKARGDSWDD